MTYFVEKLTYLRSFDLVNDIHDQPDLAVDAEADDVESTLASSIVTYFHLNKPYRNYLKTLLVLLQDLDEYDLSDEEKNRIVNYFHACHINQTSLYSKMLAYGQLTGSKHGPLCKFYFFFFFEISIFWWFRKI